MSVLWDRLPERKTMGRALAAARCRACRAEVVAGDDEDWGAFLALADPEPITVAGEALAILTARPTYELCRSRRGFELSRRDWRDLQFRPAGERADVLAWHMCGQLLPGAQWVRPIVSNSALAECPPF